MTVPWIMSNIGAALKAVYGVEGSAATAAGTGDNTAVNCAIVDLVAQGNPRSMKIVVPFTTTLTEDKVLAITAIVQHGDESDLSDAATYATLMTAATVATGDTGGSTETGCLEFDVDLSGSKQYMRIVVTPNLSATGTDTSKFGVAYVLGGFAELPATGDDTE